MITTEEIAVVAYNMLKESNVSNMITGQIDYERNDYTKEDVIIVPHRIDGEQSVRFGEVKVNIHVPDIIAGTVRLPVYRINFPRLTQIKGAVIEVLRSHYQDDAGWGWTIGGLDPPIKEPGKNEHFVSLSLEITVREKTTN